MTRSSAAYGVLASDPDGAEAGRGRGMKPLLDDFAPYALVGQCRLVLIDTGIGIPLSLSRLRFDLVNNDFRCV